MSKTIKKLLKIIVDILTVLVFIILAAIIFAKFRMMSTGEDYFEVFGYSVFSVATGSMEPAISQNDVVIVKKTNDYGINDIVTFKNNDSYITHRIIERRGKEIITKGDANNAKDVEIDESVIVGEVVKIFSNIGVWQKVFSTPKIIIMIFITLILFDFAFSYKGIQKKQNIKLVNKVKNVSLEEVRKREDSPEMTKKEIKELTEKTEKVINGEEVKFEKKEKEFLNYTIRLDLGEIEKEIKNRMNGE